MSPDRVVFLLNVGNTLLDNDRVERDPNLLGRMVRYGI
jgi:hypothetical protein